jgi:hypothetical protein
MPSIVKINGLKPRTCGTHVLQTYEKSSEFKTYTAFQITCSEAQQLQVASPSFILEGDIVGTFVTYALKHPHPNPTFSTKPLGPSVRAENC